MTVFISIHAPARGATFLLGGSDMTVFISIHAPARGATHLDGSGDRIRDNFNPRSRTGSDDTPTLDAQTPKQFQSTLPHGERHVKTSVA